MAKMVKKSSTTKNGAKSGKTLHSFKVSVCLSLCDNVKKSFNIEPITKETTIKRFKISSELITGIPVFLQRLHYLDDGELPGENTLSECDIVSGAQLRLSVWYIWESLVAALMKGSIDQVFKLGVTKDNDYETPRLKYMSQVDSRELCMSERGAVALFIASSHGLVDMCTKLIESGANVNWKSPETLRTALHVAAAMGQTSVIDKLLEKGADVKAVDADNNTAITLASQFGHKVCERRLVQFTWQQRAASSRSQLPQPPLLPHQRFDSALPANLVVGPEAQMYRPQLIPPGEFGGTSLASPRRKVKTPGMHRSEGASRLNSRVTSAVPDAASAQQQTVLYEYKPPTDWLNLTADEIVDCDDLDSSSRQRQAADAEVASADASQRQPQQHRRHGAEPPDDLVALVIARKMQEQQEKGLAGLPYDLWLSIGDHGELFQALKHRGQLNTMLPDMTN